MLARLPWKESVVVCIRVRDDLFTLAQMRKNYLLQFFDLWREVDEWSAVDLNDVAPIFAIFFSSKMLRPVVSSVVKSGVVPNQSPPPQEMLSLVHLPGRLSADLIRLSDTYSMYPSEVIKKNLDPVLDAEAIRQHEFCGMYGDPVKLCERLALYFDKGVNFDYQKSYVFPQFEPRIVGRRSLLGND